MKKILVIAALLFAAIPALAMADETRTVAANWGLENAPADLAGFRFYRDGELVHTVTDPAIRATTFDCPIADGDQVFTLTAVDSAGGESPPSDPFTVNPPPGSAPILLQFRIGK
ncbi:MAG: hypothetical protein ACOY4W_04765 [Thermodesulfobacteriota bacterium]